MTVRLSVSLPDDLHATLVQIGAASHISAGAVVRSILSETLPRLTSMLEYLTVHGADVTPQTLEEVDAWANDLRDLLHGAPDVFDSFRTVLDEPPTGEVEP